MTSTLVIGHQVGLPDDCQNCGHPITYWRDPEGLWMQCGCDMGYVR